MSWCQLSIVLVLAVAATACDENSHPSEVLSLLDPDLMTPVDVASDPLREHRPLEVDCPAAAYGPEGGAFEVQTGVCNYGAFDQPLPIALEPGDEVRILLWHDRLDAAEPATAHVAVWVDDTVLWEQEVAIPGASATLEGIVPIEVASSADGRIGLHLHNHGFNSWRLLALDLLPH